jgi:malate dehydrogenase (oxaloacetate-decarboxylating)(NADP+)
MEIAAVHAIATLARDAPIPTLAGTAHFTPRVFGPDYLIPTPFDSRLILKIAPAVARAAMADGVATRPIDLDDYARGLVRQFYTDPANP